MTVCLDLFTALSECLWPLIEKSQIYNIKIEIFVMSRPQNSVCFIFFINPHFMLPHILNFLIMSGFDSGNSKSFSFSEIEKFDFCYSCCLIVLTLSFLVFERYAGNFKMKLNWDNSIQRVSKVSFLVTYKRI